MHDHVSPTVNKSISDCIQWTLICAIKTKNEPFGHLRGDDSMKTVMQYVQIIGHNLTLFEKKTILSRKNSTRFPTWHLNYIIILYLCHTLVQVGQNYSSMGQFIDYHMEWNWWIILWFPISLRDSSILPSIQTNSRSNPPSFLFCGFWMLFVGDTVGMAWRWPLNSI
jgi:hypothetical protein